MRGSSSPEAGTPDRPVLKGNRPGRRPTSPRSILRQRAPRHITRVGEPLGARCTGSAGSRAVSPRSARELSSPRGSPRPRPALEPGAQGPNSEERRPPEFLDGYRATAQGPAPGEYRRECGKRNKTTLSAKENWPYELCCLGSVASRARRRVGVFWGFGRNSGCRASRHHHIVGL